MIARSKCCDSRSADTPSGKSEIGWAATKTVDRHLQNSYAKIGVSSRAGAALYAMQHGLLD